MHLVLKIVLPCFYFMSSMINAQVANESQVQEIEAFSQFEQKWRHQVANNLERILMVQPRQGPRTVEQLAKAVEIPADELQDIFLARRTITVVQAKKLAGLFKQKLESILQVWWFANHWDRFPDTYREYRGSLFSYRTFYWIAQSIMVAEFRKQPYRVQPVQLNCTMALSAASVRIGSN